jgi:hypothetical protein
MPSYYEPLPIYKAAMDVAVWMDACNALRRVISTRLAGGCAAFPSLTRECEQEKSK